MSPNNTAEQEAIIHAEKQNLLISAAAGSGKTYVMTQRIAHRVAEGLLDPARLLVLTFTDEAALNMKNKIRKALPQREHQVALSSARISTLHSFCLFLMKEQLTEIKDPEGKPLLEPGFRPLEEAAARLLFEEALDDCLDAAYLRYVEKEEDDAQNEEASAFYQLLDAYGDPREMLKHLYEQLRSMPHYGERWLQALEKARREAQAFGSSRACHALIEAARLRLLRAKPAVEELLSLLRQEEILFMAKATKENWTKDADYRRQFQQELDLCGEAWALVETLPEEEDWSMIWDGLVQLGRQLGKWRKPAATGGETKVHFLERYHEEVAEALAFLGPNYSLSERAKRKLLFEEMKPFSETVCKVESMLQRMQAPLQSLTDLLFALDARYKEKKLRQNRVDFSDFEHYALQLLEEEEIAKIYRSKYQEIYVDEYQDTSEIQEAILKRIENHNRFCVGDVKQSIYRFRHANPAIFMEKLEAFQANQGGRAFHLSRNFRSKPNVLRAVNEIFASVMQKEAAELDYCKENHAFQVDREEGETGEPVSYVLVSDQREKTTVLEMEERYRGQYPAQGMKADDLEILAAIRQLESLPSSVEKAILTQTNRQADRVKAWLQWLGLPCMDAISARSEEREVRLVEAFLELLDNRLQDYPLLSVLLGPWMARPIQEEELARMRLFAQQKAREEGRDLLYFHEAYALFLASTEEERKQLDLEVLHRKCLDFEQEYQELRKQAMQGKLSEVIERIYLLAGWPARLAHLPQPELRLQRLEALSREAVAFEAEGLRPLRQFVEERKLRHELGMEDEIPVTAEHNGYRVLTIHRSKGLEFDAVALLHLSYSLRTKHDHDPVHLSESYGLVYRYVSLEEDFQAPTPLELAAEMEENHLEMAEKMRLYYVALTRAKRYLFLYGRSRGEEERGHPLAKLHNQLSPLEESGLLLGAHSFQEWTEWALAGLPIWEQAWPCEVRAEEAFRASWNFEERKIEGDPLEEGHLNEQQAEEKPISPANPNEAFVLSSEPSVSSAATSQQEDNGEHKMRFVKTTVTELKRNWEENDQEEQRLVPDINLQLPNFQETSAIRGAELGTLLHHLFYTLLGHLEDMPHEEASFSSWLENRLPQLQKEERESLLLWYPQVQKFLDSDLYARMLDAHRRGEELYRETPFTMSLDKDGPAEMIQGAIDLWFMEEEGVVLVDYKSDFISGGDDKQETLQKRYGLQLSAYATALEKATGRNVQALLIWMLREGKSYSLKRVYGKGLGNPPQQAEKNH